MAGRKNLASSPPQFRVLGGAFTPISYKEAIDYELKKAMYALCGIDIERPFVLMYKAGLYEISYKPDDICRHIQREEHPAIFLYGDTFDGRVFCGPRCRTAHNLDKRTRFCYDDEFIKKLKQTSFRPGRREKYLYIWDKFISEWGLLSDAVPPPK